MNFKSASLIYIIYFLFYKKGAAGVIFSSPGAAPVKYFKHQGIDSLEEGIINGESVKTMFSAYIKDADKDNLLSSLQNSIDKKMIFKIDISDTPNPYDVIASPYSYFRIISAVCILFSFFGIIHTILVFKKFLNVKKGKDRKSYLIVCLVLSFIGNIVRIIVFTDIYAVNLLI